MLAWLAHLAFQVNTLVRESLLARGESEVHRLSTQSGEGRLKEFVGAHRRALLAGTKIALAVIDKVVCI